MLGVAAISVAHTLLGAAPGALALSMEPRLGDQGRVLQDPRPGPLGDQGLVAAPASSMVSSTGKVLKLVYIPCARDARGNQ